MEAGGPPDSASLKTVALPLSFVVAMAKRLTKQCVGGRADFGFGYSPLRWWSGGRQQERGAASWSYHTHEQDTEWEE